MINRSLNVFIDCIIVMGMVVNMIKQRKSNWIWAWALGAAFYLWLAIKWAVIG